MCEFDELDKIVAPYKVQNYEARGSFGKVYIVGDGVNNDRILKVQSWGLYSFEEEAKFARKAHKLGVGPEIYSNGNCRDIDGTKTKYIYMQRLNGGTFRDNFPYTSDQFRDALDVYYKLYQNGIDQNDFYTSNLMYNDDKLYMIDYGLAKYVDNEKPYGHLRGKATKLCKSVLMGNNDKWNDVSSSEKEEIIRDSLSGVNSWLHDKFPEIVVTDLTIFEMQYGMTKITLFFILMVIFIALLVIIIFRY